MSIYDKFKPLLAIRQELKNHGVESVNVVIEKVISQTEAVINGKRTILAGTNNYLGLTAEADAIEIACEAMRQQGTGTNGSRMANGTFSSHVALERDFAEFYGLPYCIVFSTGYVANLGLISGLAGAGDVILIDAHSHASIYDGCRLAGAEVIRFHHNDVNDLEKRLRRLGERARDAVIIIEGIYSMLGDTAPIAKIVELKQKYSSILVIDEAHSLGILGEGGRGLCEAADVIHEMDYITGTFSKSLGSIGGFCVSPHQELEYIRCSSRPYIFTASPTPATIATTRITLQRIQSRPELRERLWANSHQLYNHLQALGYELGPEPSPVISVKMQGLPLALAMWQGLLERGIYVNVILPPAIPENNLLLRISLSASHTPEQMTAICHAFEAMRPMCVSSKAISAEII